MSRRKLRAQLAEAVEQRIYWGKLADDRKAALSKIKDRIRAEYDKHVPVVDATQYGLRIGNWATLDVLCAADNCHAYWPCPQWHMLRGLYGFDRSDYAIKFERIRQNPNEDGEYEL